MLVAHQLGEVRHVLRTLIEAENIAVVEVADGEAALDELERMRFDLLLVELASTSHRDSRLCGTVPKPLRRRVAACATFARDGQRLLTHGEYGPAIQSKCCNR